ncbi:MAG: DNA translocase FtsK [Oscillospiraceae bacterium]|nr:DNA translocase FtsK [Oscillospiraceae bacterium]
MAQKSTSAAKSGGTKKTGGSGKTGAAKKTASAGGRKSSSASGAKKTTQTKKPAQTKKTPPPPPPRPIQRQAGCLVLLFLGLVALIAWFPVEGWLVDAFRTLLRGLFGWGFYLAPVALLWASGLLGLHPERPAGTRAVCVLLLPVVFGAFVHMLVFQGEGLFVGGFSAGVQSLWQAAQEPAQRCGGVVSGLIGLGLKKAVGVVGSFLVLVAAFGLMILKALDKDVTALWEAFKNRPRPTPYEPELLDDIWEEPAPPSDDVDWVKERVSARGKKTETPVREKKSPRHRSLYDEDWEMQKDWLFAEMEVDPAAAYRVEKALEAQRAGESQETPAPAPGPEAPKGRKAGKKTPAPEKTAPEEKTAPVESPAPAPTENVQPLDMEAAAQIAGVEIHSADMDGGAAAPQPTVERIDKDLEAAQVAAEIQAGEEEPKEEYLFPPLELLNKSGPDSSEEDESIDEVEAQLESAIRSFGVGASIVGAVHGPTITRYELKLEQGVKLNKITNLAGDIALSLGVSSVRIAPIPDKISTVGVEVPNRNVKTVWLGDVIDSDAFRKAKSKTSVAIGKDISGNVVVGNIAKMPHVLIAGTTGSGKSVCINSLILSLLYKSTPEEVRMIMIDPKMVELGIYNGMPHLYVPVVTDPKKAAGALQWSVVEMLKRYRLFSEAGVRDLTGYNTIQKNQGEATMPQVVIIIDELADLMMVASKEVEESICRVAQMGRAAGMHLVVATQRPSADVITGLMKANIPSRIAFAVSSALESRIILDQQGAEKLVGAGDMLYSPIGIGKPVRIQGAFVTDEEREEIINFVKREAEAEYSDEILAEIEKAADKDKNGKDEAHDGGDKKNDYDELLPQAVEVIFETKTASVSLLQRRLKLGYARAARLIDQLEEVGVVGPYEGSKPRQIMITKQQWQEMQYSAGTAPVDTIAQEFNQVAESDEFAPTEEELAQTAAQAEETAPWEESS